MGKEGERSCYNDPTGATVPEEGHLVCTCKCAQSRPTLCDPMDHSPPAPLSMRSTGKNTGAGCHLLLQGIFLTQGSNPGLLHCRQTLYHLSYPGGPQVGMTTRLKMKRTIKGNTHRHTNFSVSHPATDLVRG